MNPTYNASFTLPYNAGGIYSGLTVVVIGIKKNLIIVQSYSGSDTVEMFIPFHNAP